MRGRDGEGELCRMENKMKVVKIKKDLIEIF
jgi:hypothetical protein